MHSEDRDFNTFDHRTSKRTLLAQILCDSDPVPLHFTMFDCSLLVLSLRRFLPEKLHEHVSVVH